MAAFRLFYRNYFNAGCGLFVIMVCVAIAQTLLAKPEESAKPAAITDAAALDVPPAEKPESEASAPEPQPKSVPEKSITPRPGGELPWLKREKKSDPLPVIRPPAGVREILEKYDIGESQLDGFFNGQPLSNDEREMLVRIMYRLPRIGLDNLQKWRRTDIPLEQLVVNSAQNRLEVIPLKGRLIGLEQVEVSEELGRRLEIKHFYLARIDLIDQPYEAIVAVRRVPKWWEQAPVLNEPVSFDGIFIKVMEPTANKPQLVFLSRRLRWHPDRELPEMFIGPDQLRLAQMGLDISLIEDLRLANRRDIGDIDREPFYQLLDLVGHATNKQLTPQPPRAVDVVPLLQEPEKHQGEIMTVSGIARRITKVVVDDADIRKRFNIDHYYMIDMGVNLGEQSIRFGDDPTGEKNAVYYNDFPVTLCVRQLPSNLNPADKVDVLISANGIFMKTWAYRSAYMAKYDNKLQIAPLFVGKIPQRVVLEKGNNWVSDALVFFAIGTAVLIIGFVFWWYRGSSNAVDRVLQEMGEQGQHPNFKGLENAPTGPDFSGLAAADSGPPKSIDPD
ncbi:hypothetical protein NA78x_003613 [Anatilimnocola sp. NA78]|uniref:hypothetical protein n=1 Tax=Anatilimnocola sp. NA78 TaxID=3415683 RepID=UPI003CE4594D